MNAKYFAPLVAAAATQCALAAQQCEFEWVDSLPTQGGNPDLGRSIVFHGQQEILIGAPEHNDGEGLVQVKRLIDGDWTLQAPLDTDEFGAGASLAISGDLVFVGAPDADHGRVKAFAWDGLQWNSASGVDVDDASPLPNGSRFGQSLAADGDLLVVGAPGDDILVAEGGSAYVTRRIGNISVQVAKLLPNRSEPYDWFGEAVAIDGSRIVVGAPQDNKVGNNPGRAFVYELVGAAWVLTAELLCPDCSGTTDRFGATVAVSDDRAFVGAPNAGKGFMFHDTDDGWVLEQSFDLGSGFGKSAILDEGLLICSSSNSAGLGNGTVHTFELTSSGWTETGRIDREGSSNFGASLDLLGGQLAVGSPGNSTAWQGKILIPFAKGGLDGCPDTVKPNGGEQLLRVAAGPEFAGDFYYVLGTFSGTVPGIPLGAFTLPLNYDAYFAITLAFPNNPPPMLANFGLLDEVGMGSAFFIVPQASSFLDGVTFDHAYLVLDPVTLSVQAASNPVSVLVD